MRRLKFRLLVMVVCLGLAGAAMLASLGLAGGSAKAGNLLANPSFDVAPNGQVVPAGWTYFAPPTVGAGAKDYWVAGPTDYGVGAHSGTYFWKQWNALYSTPPSNNVAGIGQNFVSAPGDVYQAGGWFCTSSQDAGGLGAGCVTWIQVEFLDAQTNVLALYKSANFSAGAGLDTWCYYAVTNACDVSAPVATGDPYFNTYAVTGAVSQLVAPPGAAQIRYRSAYLAVGTNAAGSAYFDDAVLNQLNGPVGAPGGVVVAAGDQSVILHWNPNSEGYVSGYNVYRSLAAGGPFVRQNGNLLTAPGFCDLNVTNGRVYYYAVTAQTALARESLTSSVSSAAPKAFASDDDFLDYVQQANFDYFWYLANPTNGLIPDRSTTTSPCSIAAVGFGLTAIGIGIDHGWITRSQGAARVRTTLRTFFDGLQGTNATGVIGYKGWFYHFLDMNTAVRAPGSELSSIDTTLLLAGILYAKQYFTGATSDEAGVRLLADAIFNRVDWPWMAQGTSAVSMGWNPPGAFIANNWLGYNEAMILYLLGLGAATNPLPASAWSYWTGGYAWTTNYDQAFVAFPPLFAHEYSQCWVDFRHVADAYMNSHGSTYFENSRRAALAQRAYCVANPSGWPGYGSNVWGLTACDDPYVGYLAHGAPPALNDNGTLAPTAPAGAVALTPEFAVPALRHLYSQYRTNLWTANGFRDAFNLRATPWFDTDALGIDQGPAVVMIENYRTQRPWKLFMQNAEVQRGLLRAGFVQLPYVAVTVRTSPTQNLSALNWSAQAGRAYQVEYSTDLLSWCAAPTGAVLATGPAAQWIDNGPPGTESPPFQASRRFYRVFQFGSP